MQIQTNMAQHTNYHTKTQERIEQKESFLDPLFAYLDQDRPVIDPASPEWRVITYKEYNRSSKIALPEPVPLPPNTLEDILRQRKSERNFSEKPLSRETLGDLLYWSAGLKSPNTPDESRRFYPSGGARFPIEIYVANFKEGALPAGTWHYNVRGHTLEKLAWAAPEKIKHSLTYDFAKSAAAIIMLAYVKNRNAKKYGNLGYKLGLLEAGHLGQNIYLVGTALGLNICALGGINYEVVQRELNLGGNETVFYQFAIGRPA